jgi:hypothetical protein
LHQLLLCTQLATLATLLNHSCSCLQSKAQFAAICVQQTLAPPGKPAACSSSCCSVHPTCHSLCKITLSTMHLCSCIQKSSQYAD